MSSQGIKKHSNYNTFCTFELSKGKAKGKAKATAKAKAKGEATAEEAEAAAAAEAAEAAAAAEAAEALEEEVRRAAKRNQLQAFGRKLLCKDRFKHLILNFGQIWRLD